MRISRFKDYGRINEMHNETPEQYIKNALLKVKHKIEKMFAGAPGSDETQVRRFAQDDQGKSGSTIAELGVELESIEMSRYSRTLDNVRVKFSDEESLYDLMIGIELSEAVPEKDKEFSVDDIKNCVVKFKKYDKHEPGEVVAEITNNVKLEEIDEDLLVELKIRLDEESGEEEGQGFEIETE
jgi:hypothetical protein